MSPAWRSRVGQQIAAYLALKTALGRRFFSERYIFVHLDRFLAGRRAAALTSDAFVAWCRTFLQVSPTVRRTRMRVVRNFCLYLRRRDPTCFVPDPSGFPAPHVARRPHIFSQEQIVQLLRVATKLSPRSTSLLRAQVFRLAVVLLYTAGLRRGEVVRLVISDYDPVERTLLVRASKFHKSRLVALSKSTTDEMERYLRARRRLPHHAVAPLLLSNYHGPHAYSGVSFGLAMRRLFRAADVRRSDGRFPRVHDLRHTCPRPPALVPRRSRRSGKAASARNRDGSRLSRVDGVLPLAIGAGRRGCQCAVRATLPQDIRSLGDGTMSVAPNALARALRGFFADHLPGVRGMSPHTVCSYRDAFTLLLRFIAARRNRSVVKLDFEDLSPDSVIAFLHHLEKDRGNGAATRNARLAAVHAFARFVATNHPEHLELCQRILAVPFKRAQPRIVEYLEAAEIAAILDAPDRTTPDGPRSRPRARALQHRRPRPGDPRPASL
jgi:integrase/recombinase XerD